MENIGEFAAADARRAAEKAQRQAEMEEKKRPVQDRLVRQYEAEHGEVTDAALLLIDEAAYLEVLLEEARSGLTEGGLRESYPVSTYRNGSRENRNLGMLLKLQSQQAKLLRELRLLPGGRKGKADGPEGDEPDDDISDY